MGRRAKTLDETSTGGEMNIGYYKLAKYMGVKCHNDLSSSVTGSKSGRIKQHIVSLIYTNKRNLVGL